MVYLIYIGTIDICVNNIIHCIYTIINIIDINNMKYLIVSNTSKKKNQTQPKYSDNVCLHIYIYTHTKYTLHFEGRITAGSILFKNMKKFKALLGHIYMSNIIDIVVFKEV